MTPVTIGAGVVLLLFGRRVFWLFVALTGFLAGAWIAAVLLPGRGDAVAVAVALGSGCLGALLALFAQKVAVGVGGFLAGALLGQASLPLFPPFVPGWAVMMGAGIVGAVLLLALLDGALMALSALLGASVLAQALPLLPWAQTLAFVALALFGIVFQARRRKPRARLPDPPANDRKR